MLVIDDDQDVRELIQLTLVEIHGCTVDLAPSGTAALARLRSGELRPDLILLDLHMPDMGAGEVLRRLKGRGATRHIPVVLLTGDHTPHGLQVARTLYKPIDIEELGPLLDWSAAAQAPSLEEKVSAIRARFLEGARATVEAWAAGDDTTLRADAHRLGGTAAQLALPRLAELFRAVEREVGTRSLSAEIEELKTLL